MVAAEQDRQPAVAQFGADGVHHRAVPRHDFGEVAIALGRRLPGVARADQVAAVDHVEAARGQRLAQAGDAQRLRAHRRAARAGADVGRHADQGHGG